MDATGPGLTFAEYTADRYGRPLIEEITLNDAWYREHMLPFQDSFEDQTIDLPRDADIKNDLRALELIDGIIKLPRLTVSDTKNPKFMRHGDAAIALALGHYKSINMGGGPVEYKTISKRRFGGVKGTW